MLVVWFVLSPTLCYASETVTNQTYTYDWREAERELLEYSQDSGGISTWTVTDDDVANGLVQANFVFNDRKTWKTKYNSVPYVWQSPLSINVFEFSSAYSTYPDLQSGDYGNGIEFCTHLTRVDSGKLIDKNEEYHLTLNGFKHQMRYNYRYKWSASNGGGSGGGVAYYPVDINSLTALTLQYYGVNGEYISERISNDKFSEVITTSGDTFGIDLDLVAPNFDVKALRVVFSFTLSAYNWSVPDASSYHSGASHDSGTGIYFETVVYNGVLKITTPDETSGLLSGIIEWLRSIRDGIVNVANYVLELPSRIWTFIQEGLKMLFIPSEADISNMHEQWQNLMRDRFGAIYESGDIVHSFSETMSVNSAMVADTGGIITMPAVTANLAGTDFTFGGYDVDLVPDGFQWLVTSLKMLINIVCTILFINALKGKIEVLLR